MGWEIKIKKFYGFFRLNLCYQFVKHSGFDLPFRKRLRIGYAPYVGKHRNDQFKVLLVHNDHCSAVEVLYYMTH